MGYTHNNLAALDSLTNSEIESIPFILQKKYYEVHSTELKMMMHYSSRQKSVDEISKRIESLEDKIKIFEHENSIEWTTISIVADKKGLTGDAIRKQLQNGDFEEGVDFKYDGNKIVVHQGAIGRLQRKRRSNNG